MINLDAALPRLSKTEMEKLATIAVSNPAVLTELFSYFIHGQNNAEAFRASWVIGTISEKTSYKLILHAKTLQKALQKTPHHGVKRELLRVFKNMIIPEAVQGPLFDCCIQFMLDPKEKVAIHHHGFKIIDQICQNHPDLIPEAKAVVEETRKFSSDTFKAMSQKVTSKWEKENRLKQK